MGCGISLQKEKFEPANRPQIRVEEGSVDEAYEIGRLLGKGAFAVVYHAKERKGEGREVALKFVAKRHKRFSRTSLMDEVSIMSLVRHPNCLSLYAVYEDDEHATLAIELAIGGELFDRVARVGHLSEKAVASIIRQVLGGVEYLHSMGICHRDLKPENILMASDKVESPMYQVVKIADFGLSSMKGDLLEDTMKTACGTTEWMAPEVINAVMERANLLNFLSNQHSRYSSKIDIWAVGSIFYTLCCGKPPFYSENITATMGNILTGKYSFYSPAWDSISKDAKSVIAEMLQLDPSKRPTASECRECAWLRNEKAMSDEDSAGAAKTLQDYNRARKKAKVMVVVTSVARMETLARRRRSSVECTVTEGHMPTCLSRDEPQSLLV